jgi:hypothetical protein
VIKHRRRQPNHPSRSTVIGTFLTNDEVGGDYYVCSIPNCANDTFGRVHELKRHYASKHGGVGGKRQQFWCPVTGCDRSKTGLGKAFPRKDKMKDHSKRMHADKVGEKE